MKNYTLLYINTTALDQAEIALISVHKLVKKTFKIRRNLSERLLVAIDRLLTSQNLPPGGLGRIVVRVGAGSFSGMRVGVATANALGYALQIAVYSIESPGQLGNLTPYGLTEKSTRRALVTPRYSAPPTITLPKDRTR